MPLLDIIVTHYKEPYEVVAPFFDLLKSQKGVDFNDFRVWLIHDGAPDFLIGPEKGPLNLVERILPHRGVSACRNYGLDRADAKWICFCDCDDSYTSIFSLMMILHVLKDQNSDNFDMIWGPFYMHFNGGLAKCENPNSVFIHNKYYRLDFLRKHNIGFNEGLYMSEDGVFNLMVQFENARIGQINHPEPLYAWCRRPGSITMDFSKWISNTEGHFQRNLYVLGEYRRRKHPFADSMVARVMTDGYVMLTKQGVKGDQTAIRKKFKDFYLENQETYHQISQDVIETALAASDRDIGSNEMDKKNRSSLEEWIKELTK